MTRHITATTATALCAMMLMAGAHLSAQSKPAAKTTPAKAAPAKVVAKQTTALPANTVTMTGCLEADGRKFMLTDLEGAQAPKSRSWKTGFVTKKSKDMEVVGASGVKLGDHLGRKVTVVGVHDGDAHLTARSIKQLSASCS
jgi:hypothetical protein